MEITRDQVRPVRRIIQEVLTAVLEFPPGLLGLYGVCHCHDEAVPLLPVDLDVFCESHPEASTELHILLYCSILLNFSLSID
jgi:hypothetical protein